ncbi:hypothetical protein CDD83_8470 [Cordyceps sp. RAO-2017]|nr:hypothetical protein CDD83_8470 [Cordyceps sp. RAO-2017]
MARRLAHGGEGQGDAPVVVFEQYEAMAHCFALVLSHTPVARRCLGAWAAFIRAAVVDPASLGPSSATAICVPSLREVPLDFDRLSDIDYPAMCRQIARQESQYLAQQEQPPMTAAAAAVAAPKAQYVVRSVSTC